MTYISVETLHKLFTECDQKITTDTRKLTKGAIFFALKGDNFDANTFVETAVKEGCAYAITDNKLYANGKTILLVEDTLKALQQLAKYHRNTFNIPVIGITGSNGKTTNKELIFAVLSQKYNVLATKGNLNNHIGVPLTLLGLNHKNEIAIIEMGANHQGEIEFLCDIANPNFGIITNIGKAHLEGFGGIEGVKKGKSELYKHIKNKQGIIFINGDDTVLNELSIGIEKIVYGENENFDLYGKQYSNSEYVEFKWSAKNNSIENKQIVKTHMFGHYNFINMLGAACIGNYFNVEETNINEALSSYNPEMNRSQVIKTKTNTLILDAYNANPTSMSLAISNFINQNFDRSVFILGDMLELGEYTSKEHEAILNQLMNAQTHKVWLVGSIFFEFKTKFQKFQFFKNADDLIEFLKHEPNLQSTLLIKGSRGVRLEKLVDFL